MSTLKWITAFCIVGILSVYESGELLESVRSLAWLLGCVGLMVVTMDLATLVFQRNNATIPMAIVLCSSLGLLILANWSEPIKKVFVVSALSAFFGVVLYVVAAYRRQP